MGGRLDAFLRELDWNDNARRVVERDAYTILNRKPIIIKGFFGVGKTRRLMRAALYIYYKTVTSKQFRVRYRNPVVVVALPLRRLRDQVYSTYFDSEVAFKVVAHDEYEPELAKRLKTSNNYWVALAEHLKNDECRYREHVKELIEAIKGNKIIVTTHALAPVIDVLAKAYKRNPIVVFDEAEDFIVRLGNGVDASVVEMLKNIDKRVYNKVRRAFEHEHEKYYVRFSTVRAVLRDAVLASATFPKTLEYVYPFIAGKELDSTTFFTRGRKEKDVLIFLRQKLLYKDYEKWRRPVLTTIIDIVEKGVRKYKRVGIVSRRYSIAIELANLMREIGYEVAVDAEKNFKDRIKRAHVIILTTKGRLYRGINILVGSEDVPVVIALWQGTSEKRQHPKVIDILQEIGDFERDIWPMFVKEVTMAKNIQAVYRFVRRHDRRHVIVLLDERFYHAYYHWFKDYLYEKVVKVEVEDVEKLADVVKQYL